MKLFVSFLRNALVLFVIFALSTTATIAVGVYAFKHYVVPIPVPNTRTITSSPYGTYLTIQSFDPTKHILIAYMRSQAVDQDILTQITLDNNFTVVRRDATVENG